MSRHKVLNKETKKFRAFEVRDWLQDNKIKEKMCKWCGDKPPIHDSDYCSESCIKNGRVWQFSELN